MVNTEVGSGDFVVNRDGIHLVEWARAAVSRRSLDLARFIAPTNTRWNTDIELSQAEKDWFLTAYGRESAHVAGHAPPPEELAAEVDLLERAVIFRDLAKCYSAYCQAVESNRVVRNRAVLNKIEVYLNISGQWLNI